MAKMKAVQVPKAGADFELVEREMPQPGAGQVRIHVQARGICHSDVITKEGLLPGITYRSRRQSSTAIRLAIILHRWPPSLESFPRYEPSGSV